MRVKKKTKRKRDEKKWSFAHAFPFHASSFEYLDIAHHTKDTTMEPKHTHTFRMDFSFFPGFCSKSIDIALNIKKKFTDYQKNRQTASNTKNSVWKRQRKKKKTEQKKERDGIERREWDRRTEKRNQALTLQGLSGWMSIALLHRWYSMHQKNSCCWCAVCSALCRTLNSDFFLCFPFCVFFPYIICLTMFLNEFHCIFFQSRVFRFHLKQRQWTHVQHFERASSSNISTSWTLSFFFHSVAVQFVRWNSLIFCVAVYHWYATALHCAHSTIHTQYVCIFRQCNQCQQIELQNAMCARNNGQTLTFVRYFGIILCIR